MLACNIRQRMIHIPTTFISLEISSYLTYHSREQTWGGYSTNVIDYDYG